MGGDCDDVMEPGRIKKLPEHVVNKIAAGEILQRPSSAVKELMENSIDAKSSSIQVSVKDAGFKLLQLQDDGCGIEREGLLIICDRFTTSKLAKYSDLQVLSTHGFRGEALASISLVSSLLTITTRTRQDEHAYRACYKEGKLVEPGVRPQAGNPGTLISIENLFFNMPLRRESLSNHSEEFNRISSLVTKYALHYFNVSFSFRKLGESNCNSDFSDKRLCRSSACTSQKEKLLDLYGSALARDCIEVEVSDWSTFNFSCKGWISRPSYVTKKLCFILFVNNRLVDCAALKKSLQNVYSVYLMKGNCAFVYLSLSVKGEDVDVNVHPTKEEVKMLHEEEIVDKISKRIDQLLINCNSHQQFVVSTVNPFQRIPLNTSSAAAADVDTFVSASPLNKTTAGGSSVSSSPLDCSPCHMVRTDPRLQTLHPFLRKSSSSPLNASPAAKCNDSPSQTNSAASAVDSQPPSEFSLSTTGAREESGGVAAAPSTVGGSYPPRRTFKLTSVLGLRRHIEAECCGTVRDRLSNCSYVGSSSPEVAFVQHATDLWLVNMQGLSEQLFYQILIYDFGNFGRFTFNSNNLSCRNLVKMALTKSKKYRDSFATSPDRVEQVASEVENKFSSRCKMLLDYFSLQIIPETGQIRSMPMLLRDFQPSFEILPELVTSLGLEGCWDKEQQCFESFARIIARYYSVSSRFWIHRPESEWKYVHEHVLLPAMKLSLQPSKHSPHLFVHTASLPQLYKIFERC